nr:lytic transglycosylase domain-containing protein [Nitratireductor mangrovi]
MKKSSLISAILVAGLTIPVAYAQEQPTSRRPADMEKAFAEAGKAADRKDTKKGSATEPSGDDIRYATSYARAHAESAGSRAIEKATDGKLSGADDPMSPRSNRDEAEPQRPRPIAEGKEEVRYATSYAKAAAESAGSEAIDNVLTGSVRRPDAVAKVARSSSKEKAARTTKQAPGKADKAAAKPVVVAKGSYGGIISRYAASYGVPVSLATAVVRVESNFRPNARGRAGEIGLMQIKPATARMMGYSGSAKGLYHPETNIKYGMKYLGQAHKLGGGSTCGTILKYNAGHGAKRMNRISAAYCAKVKRHLKG